MRSVRPTSDEVAVVPSSCRPAKAVRESRTPRMWARRLRFGSTDFSYASCELKSRFQYAGRLATDAASSSSRNLSTPATRCDAMSPSRVSGFVSSLCWAFRCSAQKSSDGRSVIFFMDRASSVGRQPCLSRRKRLRRPTRSGPLRCSRRGRPAGHPSSRPSPWASTGLARLATAWRCQKRGRAG